MRNLLIGALLVVSSWGATAWLWTHPRTITVPTGAVATQDATSAPAVLLRPKADSLKGRVIGAVTIYVPVRDTLVIHDTLVTRDSAGTRTASFHDSTFAGVLAGNVVAPPFPAPLSMAYTLTRPAFTPTVGLIQRGHEVHAVVEWQGERAEVQSAFALPQPPRPRLVGAYVQGTYGWTTRTVDAEGGLTVRLPQGVKAAASYRWQQGGGSEARIGLRTEF